MISGNRGEWSELYAFLKVLGDGKILSADANLNILPGSPFIPVVSAIRKEKNREQLSYLRVRPSPSRITTIQHCLKSIAVKLQKRQTLYTPRLLEQNSTLLVLSSFQISKHSWTSSSSPHSKHRPQARRTSRCKSTIDILGQTPFADGASNLKSDHPPPS